MMVTGNVTRRTIMVIRNSTMDTIIFIAMITGSGTTAMVTRRVTRRATIVTMATSTMPRDKIILKNGLIKIINGIKQSQ